MGERSSCSATGFVALLSLKVPEEIARQLSRVDIPGERVQRDQMHVSVLYLEDTDLSTILRALEASYQIAAGWRSFVVRVHELSSFDPNPTTGLFPLIGRVQGAPLHALRAACCRAFNALHVPYSTKYPTYEPHVTLAYGDAPFGTIPVHDVAWIVNSLTLWGGDDGDNGIEATIPFGGPTPERRRLAVKAARLAGY